MASNQPKPFTSYCDAVDYAKQLAYNQAAVRCVGLFAPGKWLVGTKRQLGEVMGLEPLVCFGSGRKVKRTLEERKQVFAYVNSTGDVKKTAKKFNCSVSGVYRIINEMRSKK